MSRYDGSERPVPVLDVLYPYAGACAFCGFGDKRHRLADVLVDYPADPERVAEEWGWPDDQYAGVTPEAVATLRDYAHKSRRRRRHRWEVRP